MMTLSSDIEQGGDSRKQSDALLILCGWRRETRNAFCKATGQTSRQGVWISPDGKSRSDAEPRPHPVESVDDGLKLVPEGWYVKAVGYEDGCRDKGCGNPYAILKKKEMSPRQVCDGSSATPARALAAAISKVLESDDGIA